MDETTAKLEAIQRAIEAQDRELEAAREELASETGSRALAVQADALDRLHSVCAYRPQPSAISKPISGIRC